MSQAEQKPTTSKRRLWNHTPALPLQHAPFFDWPARPVKILMHLLRSWNPAGWRFLMFGLAVLIWWFFTPDLSQADRLSLSWIGPIWVRNAVILFAVAGGLHLWLLYFRGQGQNTQYDLKPMAKGAKVFTFKSQVWDNMFWSCVALQFWTFWECLMYYAYAQGWATMISFSANPIWFCVLVVLIPIWAGLHFYGLHRLLHIGPLYRHVHSWHHKNINTGPWSGLAMHPVESFTLFFDTLIFFVVASHPIHVIFLTLHHGIGAPTSHAGFDKLKAGKLELELGDFYHQLHHRFFDCNYGTLETPWDLWFKTFHDGTEAGDAHIQEMRRQAKKA